MVLRRAVRWIRGSGVDQQADPLGELLGDGLDDVALHGLPERPPAGGAEEEEVGPVGDGHVEDGLGDVPGDPVEQAEWDPGVVGLLAEALEEFEASQVGLED